MGDWLNGMLVSVWFLSDLTSRSGRTRLALGSLAAFLMFTLLSYGFTIVKAATFLERHPYDEWIRSLELMLFGFLPHRAVTEVFEANTTLARVADHIYFRFFEHLVLITIFLGAARRNMERIRYFGAICLAYVIGALAYHALPTLGPAFLHPERYAFLVSGALESGYCQTAMMRHHNAVQAGTLDQFRPYFYVAAVPSLHICHVVIALWYSRSSVPMFVYSLLFSLATAVAILGLGWHYPTDAVAGAGLAIFIIWLVGRLSPWLLPKWAMPMGEERAPDEDPLPETQPA
jgi:hypothetical protein